MEVDQPRRPGLVCTLERSKRRVQVSHGGIAHGQDFASDIMLPRLFIQPSQNRLRLVPLAEGRQGPSDMRVV